MAANEPTNQRPVLIENSTARVMGSGAAVKIERAATNGQLFAMEYEMLPHRLGSPHTHTYEDQIAYVLSGEIGYRVGDEEFYATAGSTLFMPRGITHTTFNRTSEPARMLEITTPGNLLKLFEELSALRGASDAPDEEALQRTREQYGFVLELDWIPEMEERLGLTWAG